MTNNLGLEVVLSNCVSVFEGVILQTTPEYIQPFQDAGGWQRHSFRKKKKKKKLAEVHQTEMEDWLCQ